MLCFDTRNVQFFNSTGNLRRGLQARVKSSALVLSISPLGDNSVLVVLLSWSLQEVRANVEASRYGPQLKSEKRAEVQRKFSQMLDSIDNTMAKFASQRSEESQDALAHSQR